MQGSLVKIKAALCNHFIGWSGGNNHFCGGK